MKLQASDIAIDDHVIVASGWLEVDDADDPHSWELAVHGLINGDLGDATWGKRDGVFVVRLTMSHGRRCTGKGRIRESYDSPSTGMRSLVMMGEGALVFLS
jgi:hypothetical protein